MRQVSIPKGDSGQRHLASRRQETSRDLSFSSAFTVFELLAVVAIFLILAGLLSANWNRILSSAEQAVCASKMRSIRVGLDGYLQDNRSVWPQGPQPQEPGWADFWIETLEPYDIGPSAWQCPTIRRMTRGNTEENWKIHYVPTMFSSKENIARRWPTHPWLIEVGDAHGKGPLICFPDGSVKALSRVLAEQGVR